MKILIIGSGGREHALCYAMQNHELFCSPANAGIAEIAKMVNLSSDIDIAEFALSQKIDLVVIGPEQPLVDGLSDYLRERGILVFGASKAAAELEGSKGFMKDIAVKHNIPTAKYKRFYEADEAKKYVATQSLPIVIKTDGLAAGKGVIIAESLSDAENAIDQIFAGKFGSAGANIIIEEFMQGEELSFFALSDGKKAVEFGSAQDYKRAFDGDKGLNTGGMGSYSPAPIATDFIHQEIMKNIINPTIEAMRIEGKPYEGVLFAGLMLTDEGVKLIEYNCRFGDPEIQSLVMRLDEDLGEILYQTAKGKLPKNIKFKSDAAVCVVMAAKGYPEKYSKGSRIFISEQSKNVFIFHAGTMRNGDKLLSCGGRVLGVTALGENIKQAQSNVYKAVKSIKWNDGFYRSDIAYRAINTSNKY